MFAVLGTVRKSLSQAIVGVAALTLAACSPGTFAMGPGGPTINLSRPVPVALLVPAGGENAGDNILAQSIENAARLAVADLGNVKIDLRVYPTGGNAEQAGIAAQRAADDGAKILIGPVYGGSAKVAGIAVADEGLNVLSLSNNPEVAGGNVFILGPTFANTATRLASYAVAHGKDDIMIVNADSPAENIGAQAIRGAVARSGGRIVAEESFELSQSGVISAIRPIAASARSSGAEAMFFTSGNDGAMSFLAQLLPENGIQSPTPQFIGLQRWNVPASALSLPGLQDSWFALPDQQLSANFAMRYSSTYGQPPHTLAGLAYDGIAAIGALIAAGNKDALTGAALTRQSGFVGTGGIFRLLPNGTNERGLSVVTIQNNQVVELDPAPKAFGGAGF